MACCASSMRTAVSLGENNTMTSTLSTNVQMQFMRPEELESAARAFPVVYVPFGLIEWHGRHLPMGTDALKAHAILVKTAEKFGGVVYPPVYFPHGAHSINMPVVSKLFQKLKESGFRAIVGVSGHNIPQQIQMIEKALEPVTADGTVAGVGLWEMTLSKGEEADSDHASKWETSDMMFFYPGLVDMPALGDAPLTREDGLNGLDPREHASPEVGRRKAELSSDAIGRKAQELLESLPEEERSFRLEAVTPENWWCI